MRREREGEREEGERQTDRHTETEKLGQRKDKERQSRERERKCKNKINHYIHVVTALLRTAKIKMSIDNLSDLPSPPPVTGSVPGSINESLTCNED